MKCKKVVFEKLVNAGNYSHDKYLIEIELEGDEKAEDAFFQAKKLIKRQMSAPSESDKEIAQRVSDFEEGDIPF